MFHGRKDKSITSLLLPSCVKGNASFVTLWMGILVGDWSARKGCSSNSAAEGRNAGSR